MVFVPKPIFIILLFVLILSIVSFILTSLTLFAGHKRGFMEDFALIRLNTTAVGHTLFSSPKNKKEARAQDQSDDSSLDKLTEWWKKKKGDAGDKLNNAKGSAKDKLNNIKGDVGDKIAKKLNLSDWYSLHIMDACEGSFGHKSSLKVIKCTTSTPTARLNLTEILDRQIKAGPMRVQLSDLHWPDGIQDKLDLLNDALLGLFILYALAMGCSGLSVLTCLGAFLMPNRTGPTLANLVVTATGAASCIIGSIIVTVAVRKSLQTINERGARVGISAERGVKFYHTGWVATGFMLALTCFWLARFLLLRRRDRAADRRQNEKDPH